MSVFDRSTTRRSTRRPTHGGSPAPTPLGLRAGGMVIANLDLGPKFNDRPQAQGDVAIFAWWDFTKESDCIRLGEVAKAVPLAPQGLTIRQSHWLRPEQASPLYWAPWTLSEQTVGTLVVPLFSTAQMVHCPQGHPVEHDMLRIGPGIYYVVLQKSAD